MPAPLGNVKVVPISISKVWPFIVTVGHRAIPFRAARGALSPCRRESVSHPTCSAEFKPKSNIFVSGKLAQIHASLTPSTCCCATHDGVGSLSTACSTAPSRCCWKREAAKRRYPLLRKLGTSPASGSVRIVRIEEVIEIESGFVRSA